MQYISNKKKVLVVGCTPPPYHGQAMMIKNLASGDFEELKLYLVRMSFSSAMDEVGKFNFYKVIHMFEIVAKSFYYRIRYGIKTFYYSPGGSTRAPILRDIFILFFLRIFFKKSVFHFHSAGTALLVKALPIPFKAMAKYVYQAPDVGIYLSSKNLDHDYLKIPNVAIVPNGLEDEAINYLPINRQTNKAVSILFVGIIKESKGVLILLEAIKLLKERGHSFTCKFMGAYDSEEFKKTVNDFCQKHSLNTVAEFVGVKQGGEKWNFFREADLLCFPSFYQSESFGNVLVEAMMFELPVIATVWRGIPDIVNDNVTGLLVPTQDAFALADSIQKLIDDPSLRIRMGKSGRIKYLQKFSQPVFLRAMGNLLKAIAVN